MSERARRRLFFFPVLIATYPALFVGAGAPGEFTARELAWLLLALAAAGGFVYATFLAVAGRRAPPANVALVAGLVTGWLLLSNLLVAPLAPLPQRVAKVVLAAVVAAGAGFLLRRAGERRSAARYAGRVVALLVAWAAARIAVAKWRDARVVGGSAVVRSLAEPPPVDTAAARGRPDIYLLVLDTFSAGCVMAERTGFANAAFEDSLRALGFVVPRHGRSNYPFTAWSLASLLNFAHTYPLERDVGGRAGTSRAIYYHLARRSRLVRFLKREGYTIYLVPSLGFPGTSVGSDADSVQRPVGAAAPAWPVARSSLATEVWASTVPAHLADRLGLRLPLRTLALGTFDAVRAVSRRPGPKFVLAHSLLAHGPIAVDSACRERPRLGASDDAAAYVGAVRCVDGRVLTTVRAILAASGRRAVVLVQGDHGTRMLGGPIAGPAEGVTAAQAAERFGAFGAYYLPDGGSREIADTTTAVNVIRAVLRYYLGARLAPVADDSYYVAPGVPHHFVRVASDVFRRARAQRAGCAAPPPPSVGRAPGAAQSEPSGRAAADAAATAAARP
jgi:hypothetical protein